MQETPSSLSFLVQDELSKMLDGFASDDIIVHSNRDKYCENEHCQIAHEEPENLTRIFEIMCALNEYPLSDPTIASNDYGESGFKDTLEKFIRKLATSLEGKSFNYVELGPEPVKTRYILHRLNEFGIHITHYFCVDINPASKERMEEELSSFFTPDQMTFHQCDFDDLSYQDIHIEGEGALITMTGFQEGNDHPDINTARFQNMCGANDIIITELHMSDQVDHDALLEFYHTSEMREFSRITFSRFMGDLASVYKPYIIYLNLGRHGYVPACVTTEHFVDPHTHQNKICVTNWCLKYTASQIRQHREVDNRCRILVEERTGNCSVLFQAAEATDARQRQPAWESSETTCATE